MGLKDFPSFDSESAVRRELVRQGFVVSDKSVSGNVRVEHSVTGAHAFVHLSTLTREGKTPYPVLQKLSAIGFVPPDEHNKRLREAKKAAKDTTPPAESVPDPKRRYPCKLCEVERCPKCVDRDQPCAFPMPVNLGRHTSATHPDVPRPASPPKPRPSRRSGRVRVRTDPDVIKDPFSRLAKRLVKQMDEMNRTVGELVELAGRTESELNDLRRFKKEIEDQTGRLYDITTRPRNGD